MQTIIILNNRIKSSYFGLSLDDSSSLFSKSLTKWFPHSNIEASCRGSSVVEQGTHKPLVVGSTPTLGTKITIYEYEAVRKVTGSLSSYAKRSCTMSILIYHFLARVLGPPIEAQKSGAKTQKSNNPASRGTGPTPARWCRGHYPCYRCWIAHPGQR